MDNPSITWSNPIPQMDNYPQKESKDSDFAQQKQRDMSSMNQQQQSYGYGVEDKRSQSQRHAVWMNPDCSSQPKEYALKETNPVLGGGQVIGGRFVGGDNKQPKTYDLVEPMKFLFVRVVKARDLPSMDIFGSLDPYVEIRVGDHKAVTQHISKTRSPEWNTLFAFERDKMQATALDFLVKDKNMLKEEFVGIVRVNLDNIPTRVPPDSPLAPKWYRFEGRKGELMLAVWFGTQADEAFHDALTGNVDSSVSSMYTRSQVYHSPKLWYVRVNIIEVRDLVWSEKTRVPDVYVKAQINNQVLSTKHVQARNSNALWHEDLMFVAAEPLEDHLVLTIEDRLGPDKHEILGRMLIPLNSVERRADNRLIDSHWFNMHDPNDHYVDEKKHDPNDDDVDEEEHDPNDDDVDEEEHEKDDKYGTKLHLRVCLDGGYHVLDESTQSISNLRPSAEQLWRPPIGILELGILNASDLTPAKFLKGKGSTDAYCVAKYGHKWVRTRTVIDSLNPRFNEQSKWEVYDLSTVLTVGVFDNSKLYKDADVKDFRIGKICIRISALETDRVYTHLYPLLVLHPTGVKKMGELHLAIRFSSTNKLNMMYMYSKPLLPKTHYLRPLAVDQLEMLRNQAIGIVAASLSRAEPPLGREIVEYMTDAKSHLWSMRRSKANFFRLMLVLNGVFAVSKWFGEVCLWKNPVTTVLVHLLFVTLVSFPELIITTLFLYMSVFGLWNYRFRAQYPPHMDIRLSYAHDVDHGDLDEEFDTFPTSKSSDIVRYRYDQLRSVAGRIQTVVGDIASQGEGLHGLLSWREPRATLIFIVFCLLVSIVFYMSFQVPMTLAGFYVMRHPRLRHKLPSAPFNFFQWLPDRTESML